MSVTVTDSGVGSETVGLCVCSASDWSWLLVGPEILGLIGCSVWGSTETHLHRCVFVHKRDTHTSSCIRAVDSGVCMSICQQLWDWVAGWLLGKQHLSSVAGMIHFA